MITVIVVVVGFLALDPGYGCPVRRCPGRERDPVHNFMDYSGDACMNDFSNGQGRRLLEMAALYRPRPR